MGSNPTSPGDGIKGLVAEMADALKKELVAIIDADELLES